MNFCFIKFFLFKEICYNMSQISFVDFGQWNNLFFLYQIMALVYHVLDKPTAIFKLVLYLNQIEMQ